MSHSRLNKLLLPCMIFFSLDLLAQNWVQKASLPAKGRHRTCGIAIGNKAYAGLGHMNGTGLNIIYKDWWEFDPLANSWTQKADYPTPNGNYGVAAFGTSTHGYVGGGTQLTSEFFKYDPVINAWSAIANCITAPNDQTAFSVNDKGYVQDGTALYEYSPSTDTWSSKSLMPGGGGIWTCAFTNGSSGFIKSNSQLFEYKADLDQWIEREAFPGLAVGGSGSFCVDGNGYIVAGYGPAGLSDVTKEVWRFNIASNTWTQMNDFPGSGRRFCVGLDVNNRGYFGLGTNGINFNDWWAADTYFLEIAEKEMEIEFYPNPIVNELYISGKGYLEGTLKILNEEGKLVYNAPIRSDKIDLSALPSGKYVLCISNIGAQSVTKNFIKL
jgi:N-acetylneuraminic acid mutarotase